MKFTHFYAGSAVCSPSRASLLTGKFPLRYSIRQHLIDSTDHLPERALTLAELLKDAGYATTHIGKWHLGGLRLSDIARRQGNKPALPGPLQQGLDHYLTNIEGASTRPRLITERKLYREGGHTMLRNDHRADPSDQHWTEIKINEAMDWLQNSRDARQPFFINLWFDVPHTPYEPAPEPHLSKYQKLGVAGDQLYFRSMVSHLDDQVDLLIRFLKDNDLYDNTLIIDGGNLLPLSSEKVTGVHKGQCLLSMVDILCCVLSGANWRPFGPPSLLWQTPLDKQVGKGIGHFFGVMDIEAFRDKGEFKQQMDQWIATIRGAKPQPGTSGPLIPGDPERVAYEERSQSGIPVLEAVVRDLEKIAQLTGVKLNQRT